MHTGKELRLLLIAAALNVGACTDASMMDRRPDADGNRAADSGDGTAHPEAGATPDGAMSDAPSQTKGDPSEAGVGDAGELEGGTTADGEPVVCEAGGITSCAASACDQVSGQTYRSVEEMECGLGPSGTASCHWQISFTTDGLYNWQYSDVVESGDFTCEGGTLVGDVHSSDDDYHGTLADGALTWEGVAYRPVSDGS